MVDFDKTIFYQFIHFLILLFLLNILLFKPMLNVINKRQNTIKGLSDGVEKAKEDMRDMEKEYESAFQEKKQPIITMKDAMVSEADGNALRMIENARSELAEELTKIRSGIEQDGKKAYEALKADIDGLSREAARKILERSL